MTLLLATLLPGILLVLLGVPLCLNLPGFAARLSALPRSRFATYFFFGLGGAWFLYEISHLSMADFGEYRTALFIAFSLIVVLAFRCVPDFLAVRGLCVLMLMAASPLLQAAYMEYQFPQRLFLVTLVYAGIGFALWLGAQPWRLRDFFAWLFARRSRSRGLGAALALYGVLLAAVAFTY